ncbi:integral membrane protein [Streptomyces hygroscopicus]|uniref:rhomboid-like protein n=1 Tax=Streptomyces hygroscopicus TaxID=1912 RepID=UPI002240D44E|nr:rhomboid-like protein [Streptomyces hygroscopicus]MCW7946599.1 integral membrane protein [Streptomyces hygroscopicus]
MERTVSAADATLTAPETGAPLLDGMPRQRTVAARPVPAALVAPAPACRTGPPPWLLLPTPTGTPFTFGYAVLLTLTSLFADFADPSLLQALYQGSSTDVVHLASSPVLVLVASALWIAGGLMSSYSLVFLVVLTALERRIGGARTAGVFLLGHVLATLATEIPVGLAVLAGDLPDASLHRLDYGISFGVAASLGALAGLLRPWLRWMTLIVFGGLLLQDLVAYLDPLSNWGHLLSLAIGIGTWPLVRRWQRTGSEVPTAA